MKKDIEKKQAVCVRFAPSPTGYLHIGSLRTALFNWLFARHHDGIFLVRIEDTDIERSKKEFTDAILDALAWFGVTSDEPVIKQSERFAEHKKLIDHLLKEGKAYKDYLTQDEFFEKHKQQFGTAEYAKAYRVCRDQPQEEGKPFVVRFKLPLERKEICFDDVIRGRVCVQIKELDDFVLARSDGRPMYNFVVVADDIAQGITHVIRGEDHISNTPKQLLLYEVLGKEPPVFAHIPLILSKEGHRLSKRDAATSVMEYQELGYLPEALLNYLVRLGWAHGDQEVFSRDELIRLFTLKDVGKKAGIFDQEKLDWLNGVYLRQLDNKALLDIISTLRPDVIKQLPFDEQQLLQLIEVYKQRATTVIDVADALEMIAQQPEVYELEALNKWIDDETTDNLIALIEQLEGLATFNEPAIKELIVVYAKQQEKKLGAIAQPIRIALTGGTTSPSVFALLAILGKDASLARLKALRSFLQERA